MPCKWIPISLQGEHFLTTSFWIPNGIPLQDRLRVVENLLALIYNSPNRRVRQLCCSLKISRTLGKRENQSFDDLPVYMDENFGQFNEFSHINILDALVDIFELNIKCLWQHAATSNNLKIRKVEWSAVSDPIVITINSPIKFNLEPGECQSNRGEELSYLLQQFT